MRSSDDVDRGRSPAPAPSSPPAPKHDTAVAHSHLRSPRQDQAHLESYLSPEIARLPPPRTPISVRSRFRDTSSEYYTAAWGSPYDQSPSSRSALTALSQQPYSDDFEDSSPVPDFGLEHLIPSRLGGIPNVGPDNQSPSTRLSSQPNEDEDHTPRSRTKRWVQLPRRDDSDRVHWWSDESGRESSNRSRSQHQSTSSSVEARDWQSRPTLGHKSREENQTLDQQSFWDTLRKDRPEDMSSMYESRWAATPPAEEPAKKELSSGMKASRWADTPSPEPAEQTAQSGLQASRWADTPPPQEDTAVEVPASLQASRWADKPADTDAVEQSEEGAVREVEGRESAVSKASIEAKPESTAAVNEMEKPAIEKAPETSNATNVVDIAVGETTEEGEVNEVAAEGTDENGGNVSSTAEPVNRDSPAVDHVVADDSTKDATQESAKDEVPTGGDSFVTTNEPVPAEAAAASGEMPIAPPSPTKARADIPRFRKKVSWRNRNLVVSIPALDYRALGIQMPLSIEEVQARLKQFEDAGFNVQGFDSSPEVGSEDAHVHVKPIYPDEDETKSMSRSERTKVNLPDLNRWKEYENWLVEEKLKALGVDLGGDEPPQPLAPSQGASRQSSGQFPGQTFSPPLPSTSAASMGRPGMVRGHSHTMSMASPISPLNGPGGHMRGHSVFAGPMAFLQGQQAPQQLQMPGMRAFSPQSQQPPQQSPIPGMQAFSPAFNRTGSPAQLAALRGEPPFARGPGSPLNPHVSMPSPQDYSRHLAEDQFRRQHGHSQSMQQPPVASYFPSPSGLVQPTPTLPELPEEDDEDELAEEPAVHLEPHSAIEKEDSDAKEPEAESEIPAYVPPQKRAQFNANIEIPTPRGHRHNISEGLERDILAAEKHQEAEKYNVIEVDYESSGRESNPYAPASASWRGKAVEKDPLGMDISVQEAPPSHKKSASRFQVPTLASQQSQPAPPASSFTFNPGASFQPSFTFGASNGEKAAQPKFSHTRQQSSGSFNVAAPVFKPSGMGASSVPKSDFNFSAPAFKPGAPAFEPSKPVERNVVDELPKIFGDVKIPDIVKPARRSKAVEIKRPDEARKSIGGSGTEQEDSDGRVMQSEDRIKRQRAKADDGDEVPQFAEPTPLPQPAGDLILKSQPNGNDEPDILPAVEEIAEEPTAAELAAAQMANNVQTTDHANKPSDSSVPSWKPSTHGHRSSASLSAFAKPFVPSFAPKPEEVPAHKPKESYTDVSDLEEGEIREDERAAASRDGSRSVSPEQDEYTHAQLDSIPSFPQPPPAPFEPTSARVNDFANIEPSFDEIDAVMRQLNDAEDTQPADENVENSPSISPLPSPGAHPMKGVTYLPEWSRSDAPSPSPRRRPSAQYQLPGDSSFTVHDRSDSLDRPVTNGWPHVNRLNKDDDAPVSDWSGDLSPPEQERLEQRSLFFDNRIDDIIGRVVEKRLQPLEDSLRTIQSAVARRPGSQGLPQQRSSSAVESDADDEDESEEQHQRPISRSRDKRLDQMKAIVLEALREQSPRKPSQSAYDLQELHTVLADMKMSFARAASSSLELDDIRAVVDEVVSKQSQSQALVPIAMEEPSRRLSHNRETSELEVRLKETSAGLLEEADLRRASEEREAETKRMLRLAEEELELLRQSNRDDDSRIVAAEHEREEMRAQLQAAEHAQRSNEEHVKDLERENSAVYATMEEYRTSSHKWRQDIDQATEDREELENTISDLEKQLEESQEATSGMRRRLEKLHADMASAAGQLVSEKAAWKDKEEDLKARIEMQEAREAAHLKERALLEDELHGLRASAAQVTVTREMTDNQERSVLEDELVGLRAGAAEAVEMRTALEQLRASNTSLDDMVRKLQGDLTEQQSLAARFEREFHEARDAGRAEVQRTRLAMEIDIEQANHQVNIVRAELDGELTKVRAELESAKMEAETAKARHERFVEEEDESRREALRKVNHTNSVALDEARQKHDAALHEMQKAHDRQLSHALEDKQRSEYFLNERLGLSDEKLQHFHDKVLLLEDKLEVAKSAATAAAARAQAPRAMPAAVTTQSTRAAALPEKISPQALRESILVLQDQLQAREATIEKLQTQVDKEAPAKLKQRDDEITWLRELLSNRGEELTELVNDLASPTFDRASVRDAAIRIRANLQMEQQEKERLNGNTTSSPGQAIASLSNFATPKAAQQLTSAFNKWRANMESSALRNAPRGSAMRPRSNTPSRQPLSSKPSSSSTGVAPSYMHGLMTPPASNLRTTPSPETANPLPPPQLSRPGSSKSGNLERPQPKSRQPSAAGSEGPTTPLFRSQSYDQDAEDHEVRMQDFEDQDDNEEEEAVQEEDDEDLDVADDAPPAFRSSAPGGASRSLGDELEALGDEGDDATPLA